MAKDSDVVLEDIKGLYHGKSIVFLLVEDNKTQLEKLEQSAITYLKTYLNKNSSLGTVVCAVSNTESAINELKKYNTFSEEPNLKAVLDYHMGESDKDRRPVERLFLEDCFKDFLERGAIITIYSGDYLDQAGQSNIIAESIREYKNMALFFALKSEVSVDDLIRFMSLTTVDPSNTNIGIPKLRKIAEENSYNLGLYFEKLRGQKKANKKR